MFRSPTTERLRDLGCTPNKPGAVCLPIRRVRIALLDPTLHHVEPHGRRSNHTLAFTHDGIPSWIKSPRHSHTIPIDTGAAREAVQSN